VEVLGPAPSPLPRLRGKYRFQLLIKAPDGNAVRAAARQLADRIAKLPRAVQASLDVNPGNML
jgi:primosomal protein N' (replication factor Y)